MGKLRLKRKEEGEPQYWYDPDNGDDVTGDGSHSNPWKTRAHVRDTIAIGETVCRIDCPYPRYVSVRFE